MRLYAEGDEVIHEFDLRLTEHSRDSTLAREIRDVMTNNHGDLAAVMLTLTPQGERDSSSDLNDIPALIQKGMLVIREPQIGWNNILKKAITVENQLVIPLRVIIASAQHCSPPTKMKKRSDRAERVERERIERERTERERIERVRIERERLERERIERERMERELMERERLEQERLERERIERERQEREQAERDRIERERVALLVRERAERERAERARMNSDNEFLTAGGPAVKVEPLDINMFGQDLCYSQAPPLDGHSTSQSMYTSSSQPLYNNATSFTTELGNSYAVTATDGMYGDSTNYNELYNGTVYAINGSMPMYGGNGTTASHCSNGASMLGVAGNKRQGLGYANSHQLEAIYGTGPNLGLTASHGGNGIRKQNQGKHSQNHRPVDAYGNTGAHTFPTASEYRIDYHAHAELLPATACTNPPFTEADLLTIQHQSVPKEYAPYIICSVAPLCRPDSCSEHLKTTVPLPLFAYPGESSCAVNVTNFNQSIPPLRSQRSMPQTRQRRGKDSQSAEKAMSWVHVERVEDFPFPPVPWQLAENASYPMHVFILQIIAAKSPIIPCIPLRCRALATLNYTRPEDYHNMVDKCAMGRLRQEFFNCCGHLGLKIGTDAFPGIPGPMTVYQYYSVFIWCLTQGGRNKADGDSAFWGQCVRAVFPQSLPPLELDAAAGALRRLYNWTLSQAESMVDSNIRMELCREDSRQALHEQLKSAPNFAQQTPVQTPVSTTEPAEQSETVSQYDGEDLVSMESNTFWTGFTIGFQTNCFPPQSTTTAPRPSPSWTGAAAPLPPTFYSGRDTDRSYSEEDIQKLMWEDTTISLSVRDEAEAAVIDVSAVRNESPFMTAVHIAIVLLRTYGRLKLINEAALRATHAKDQNECVPVFDIGLDKASQREFLVKPELVDIVAYYRFVTIAALRFVEEPTNPKGPYTLELDEQSFINIARHSLRMQQSRNPLMYLPTGEPPHIKQWPPPPKWTVSKKSWEDYPTSQIYAAYQPPPRPPTGPSPASYYPHAIMQQQAYMNGQLQPTQCQYYSNDSQLYHGSYPQPQDHLQQPPDLNAYRLRPQCKNPSKVYVPRKSLEKGNSSYRPPPPRRSEPQLPPVPPPSPVETEKPIAVRLSPIQDPNDMCIVSPNTQQNTAVIHESLTGSPEKDDPLQSEVSELTEEEEEERDLETEEEPEKDSKMPLIDKPPPTPEVEIPSAPIQTAFNYVRNSRNAHKVRSFREPRRISERSQQRKKVQKPEPAEPNRDDKMSRKALRFVRAWNRASASTLNRHPGDTLLTVLHLNESYRDPEDSEALTSNSNQVSINLTWEGATIVPNRTFLTFIKNGLGATVPKASMRLTNTRKRGNNRIPAPGAIAGSSNARPKLLQSGRRRPPPRRPPPRRSPPRRGSLPTAAIRTGKTHPQRVSDTAAAATSLPVPEPQPQPELQPQPEPPTEHQPPLKTEEEPEAPTEPEPQAEPQPQSEPQAAAGACPPIVVNSEPPKQEPPTQEPPTQQPPLAEQEREPAKPESQARVSRGVSSARTSAGRHSVDPISPSAKSSQGRGQKRTAPQPDTETDTATTTATTTATVTTSTSKCERRRSPANARSSKRQRLGEFNQLPPVPFRFDANPLMAGASIGHSPPRVAPSPACRAQMAQTLQKSPRHAALASVISNPTPRLPHRVSTHVNPASRREQQVAAPAPTLPTPQIRRPPPRLPGQPHPPSLNQQKMYQNGIPSSQSYDYGSSSGSCYMGEGGTGAQQPQLYGTGPAMRQSYGPLISPSGQAVSLGYQPQPLSTAFQQQSSSTAYQPQQQSQSVSYDPNGWQSVPWMHTDGYGGMDDHNMEGTDAVGLDEDAKNGWKPAAYTHQSNRSVAGQGGSGAYTSSYWTNAGGDLSTEAPSDLIPPEYSQLPSRQAYDPYRQGFSLHTCEVNSSEQQPSCAAATRMTFNGTECQTIETPKRPAMGPAPLPV